MASFKLNIARIRGCPASEKVAAAMEDFGLPDSEEFGVLNHSAAPGAVYCTIVRKTEQIVDKLDTKAREVTAAPVEKAVAYPFGINPAKGALEVYAGSAKGIEQVAAFLSSCLALPTVVDQIELDIPSAVDKLSKLTDRFQLRAIRVSEYAHNSYMSGPYAPKFLDTQHGQDFLDEYAEHVTSAKVRFSGPTGRINVNLSQAACFGYSCNEDDQSVAQGILRKLI